MYGVHINRWNKIYIAGGDNMMQYYIILKIEDNETLAIAREALYPYRSHYVVLKRYGLFKSTTFAKVVDLKGGTAATLTSNARSLLQARSDEAHTASNSSLRDKSAKCVMSASSKSTAWRCFCRGKFLNNLQNFRNFIACNGTVLAVLCQKNVQNHKKMK